MASNILAILTAVGLTHSADPRTRFSMEMAAGRLLLGENSMRLLAPAEAAALVGAADPAGTCNEVWERAAAALSEFNDVNFENLRGPTGPRERLER